MAPELPQNAKQVIRSCEILSSLLVVVLPNTICTISVPASMRKISVASIDLSSSTRKLRDQFPRQNRFCPPPVFQPASACPSVVHHLSGRVSCAAVEWVPNTLSLRRQRSRLDQPVARPCFVCLRCELRLLLFLSVSHLLARTSDSSVRVSRRVRRSQVDRVGNAIATSRSARLRSKWGRSRPSLTGVRRGASVKGAMTRWGQSQTRLHACSGATSDGFAISFQNAFRLSLSVLVCYRSGDLCQTLDGAFHP